MTDAAARDAAAQREFEHSLIAAIQEASPDGILVVDVQGMIVSHNRRLFECFGLDPRDFSDAPNGSLTSRSDNILLPRVVELVKNPDEFLARVRQLYADPTLVDRTEIELKDGRTLVRHSSALWNAERQNLGRVWFFRDITERKRAETELARHAQKDGLTGVLNRRYFLEMAGAEFARARRYRRPMSVIMLDLDHFKAVNDEHGHAAGDAVLRDVADCAVQMLRQQDLFARFGGEEFVVLVPETDAAGAFIVAERLRKITTGRVVSAGDRRITYDFSAGVATLRDADASVDATIKRADDVLYEAKRAGRGRTLSERTPG